MKYLIFLKNYCAKQPVLRLLILIVLAVGIIVQPLILPPYFSQTSISSYAPAYIFFWITASTFIALLLFIYAVIRGDITPPTPFAYKPFLPWLGALILSGIFSFYPNNAFLGTPGHYADGIAFALVVTTLYLIVKNLSLTTKEIKGIGTIWIAQLTILSYEVIYEEIKTFGFGKIGRAPLTPLYNADYFISYALLLTPLIIFITYKAMQKKQAIIEKCAAWICLLITLAALFFCLPLNLQTIISRPLHLQAVEESPGEANTKQFLVSASNKERFTDWRMGLNIGAESPLFGSGPGTTIEKFYSEVRKFPVSSWPYGTTTIEPHNDFIQQFSQLGVIGLLAYAALWVFLFGYYTKKYRTIPEEGKAYSLALIIGLGCFLLFNQVLFTTLQSGSAVVVIAALALSFIKPTKQKPLHPAFQYIGFTVAGVVMLVISIMTLQQYLAESSYVQADIAYNNGNLNGGLSAINDAENTEPNEAVYKNVAADYSLVAALTESNPTVNYVSQAADLANQAELLDSNVPDYEFTYGEVLFVTGTVTQQTEGMNNILQAIHNEPWNKNNYAIVAQLVLITKGRANATTLWQKTVQQADPYFKSYLEQLQQSNPLPLV